LNFLVILKFLIISLVISRVSLHIFQYSFFFCLFCFGRFEFAIVRCGHGQKHWSILQLRLGAGTSPRDTLYCQFEPLDWWLYSSRVSTSSAATMSRLAAVLMLARYLSPSKRWLSSCRSCCRTKKWFNIWFQSNIDTQAIQGWTNIYTYGTV